MFTLFEEVVSIFLWIYIWLQCFHFFVVVVVVSTPLFPLFYAWSLIIIVDSGIRPTLLDHHGYIASTYHRTFHCRCNTLHRVDVIYTTLISWSCKLFCTGISYGKVYFQCFALTVLTPSKYYPIDEVIFWKQKESDNHSGKKRKRVIITPEKSENNINFMKYWNSLCSHYLKKWLAYFYGVISVNSKK